MEGTLLRVGGRVVFKEETSSEAMGSILLLRWRELSLFPVLDRQSPKGSPMAQVILGQDDQINEGWMANTPIMAWSDAQEEEAPLLLMEVDQSLRTTGGEEPQLSIQTLPVLNTPVNPVERESPRGDMGLEDGVPALPELHMIMEPLCQSWS